MKIYFIRHAPTLANMSGSMVPNYSSTEIIKPTQEEIDLWQERVGQHIDYTNAHIYVSPTTRAVQTADTFLTTSGVDSTVIGPLAEFDCSGLGDLKFWKITKKVFEEYVPTVTSLSMCYQAANLDIVLRSSGFDNCICVSHGMLIRYMFHFYSGRWDVHPFDIINSKDFTFSHLDMMVLDTKAQRIELHRYKEPVQHEK